MSIRKLKLAAFSAFALVLMGALHQASAGVVYTYIAEKQSYDNVPANSTVVVNIYLQELLTTQSDSSFIATDGGLQAFGVAAAVSNSGKSTLTGAAANSTDFTVFNGPTSDFVDITGASGQIAGSINSVLSPVPPGIQVNNSGGGTAPAKANAVYLGNFTVTAGPSGTTTFTLGAIDPVFGGSTVTRNLGYDLDTQVDGNFTPTTAYTGVGSNLTTFSVSVAPEPASLGLLAIGGLLALRRRRA